MALANWLPPAIAVIGNSTGDGNGSNMRPPLDFSNDSR
jgi:hypothetical protein